jgi:hypothetical protein
LQLKKLAYHRLCARRTQIKACGVAISLRVFAKVLEARIAIACAPGTVRVYLVEIIQDRGCGS